MAQHHLAFAGTISLRPSTFIAAIGDWVRSLALHGFEKILFLNGHGGNVASIEAAFSELYAEASFARACAGFALKLANWWDLEGVGELARDQFPTGHGAHATPSEIAITAMGLPRVGEDGRLRAAHRPVWPDPRCAGLPRARFPDGRLGSNPGLATRERGRALVELAAQSLARELAAFSEERPPA